MPADTPMPHCPSSQNFPRALQLTLHSSAQALHSPHHTKRGVESRRPPPTRISPCFRQSPSRPYSPALLDMTILASCAANKHEFYLSLRFGDGRLRADLLHRIYIKESMKSSQTREWSDHRLMPIFFLENPCTTQTYQTLFGDRSGHWSAESCERDVCFRFYSFYHLNCLTFSSQLPTRFHLIHRPQNKVLLNLQISSISLTSVTPPNPFPIYPHPQTPLPL